jgi:deoxyribonuclease IV
MLIGAHVPGGLRKAVAAGVERGCDTIQIFNQSPRMWKPTAYGEDDFATFNADFAAAKLGATLIHAVYLINCGSPDKVLRAKSQASLTQSLRVGDGINAAGVVLHAGSALTGDVKPAIKRAGTVIKRALSESESCPLHLENTAGAGGTLGRSFEELAALIEAAGASERLGVCLDSCHLLASGYDIRTTDGLAETLDAFDATVGLDRLGSLHLNDSAYPLGSNRDRHANIGEGELGEKGCAAFLSEPRFDRMPCALEIPGAGNEGPAAADIELCRKLRKRGVAARRRQRARKA